VPSRREIENGLTHWRALIFFSVMWAYVKRLGGKWANPVREWSPSVATTGGSLKERYNDRPSDVESK
jgi:hypothetical protein